MEKQLLPKLRFSEFEDEWKKMKLGGIGKVSMCKRIMKDQTKTFGDIPFYKIGTFGKQANAFIDIDIYEEYKTKYSYPRKGDILIAASGATYGKTVVFDGKPAFFQDSNIVWIDNDEEQVYNAFLNIVYQLIQWKIQTSTIPRLYNDIIRSASVMIPSIPEQEKIASFLTDVDNKITQLTKKKELLEQYKKGIMQQFFNQELRFKDDDGNEFPEWSKNKIGNVFNSFKGKGIPKGDLTSDGVNKCVLYGQLYTTYNEVINQVVSSTNSDDGLKSKKGDLLIPSSTTTTGIDLANVTALNFEDILLGGDIIIMRGKKEINNIFYAYYLSNYKKHQIASRAQGITIVHLYFNSIKDLEIDIPAIEEQTKIANFLSDIDAKIESVQSQIERSKTFKKGLLQQMFV
ncbi:restriction endonuclease subunit S [Dokdonia donghaensis]|uniref:restriction endonuclease subunit S n=1 Tax=Dokdonia donghaensis TaxID=326320 RepID=UPI00068E2947|nr:restriction endonuclease subunit S [Dokdonia donghaensis]ANH60857.1 EcoKI restriction-modification system protein HsdS [Dokdonia donghaensis DSW-1]